MSFIKLITPPIILLICSIQLGHSASLDEESMLLAEHTGIELRQPGRQKCSAELLLVVRSALAAPLFHRSESFRSRVISHNLRGLVTSCIGNMSAREYRVLIFLNGIESGKLTLVAIKQDHDIKFKSRDYSFDEKAVVSSPPTFYDRALVNMAAPELEEHFGEITIPELTLSDIAKNSSQSAAARFLSALDAEGRSSSQIFANMYYQQGYAILPCDFDRAQMALASDAGYAYASFLTAECLFESADVVGGRFASIDYSKIDLSSLKEEFPLMIFHAAKYMHASRMLEDGLELAQYIRHYSPRQYLDDAQEYVDTQPINVTYPAYLKYVINK